MLISINIEVYILVENKDREYGPYKLIYIFFNFLLAFIISFCSIIQVFFLIVYKVYRFLKSFSDNIIKTDTLLLNVSYIKIGSFELFDSLYLILLLLLSS